MSCLCIFLIGYSYLYLRILPTLKKNFDVLLTVHLSIFILVINQHYAQNFFTVSLFYASTCFEHHVLETCRGIT